MEGFAFFLHFTVLVAVVVTLPLTVARDELATCKGVPDDEAASLLQKSGKARVKSKCKKKYHPHFDTTPDYLNIAADARGVNGNPGSISDNYYMVIGDQGGCSAGPLLCGRQTQVADLMKEYHRKRKEANPNSKLLFVITVGDNFYWMGADASSFERNVTDQYSPEGRAGTLEVYGPELMGVPWFPVMGNHDYGNNDNTSVCPDVRPRFVCDERNKNSPACGGKAPYSTEEQGYGSNQLNVNKGGMDGPLRENYHMPDYTYYYTIPSLDFELVAMDWNWYDIEGLGGEGPEKSASQILEHCGSLDSLNMSLMQIMDASTELLQKRSAAAEHQNVAIIGHYPACWQANQSFRDMYIRGAGEAKAANMTIFNFYGHVHTQQCEGADSSGQCVEFLTGGGGGCCYDSTAPKGFGAIGWNSDGKHVVECFDAQQPDGMTCTLPAYNKDDDKPPWPTAAPAAPRSLMSIAAAGPLPGNSTPTQTCGCTGILPTSEDCLLHGGAPFVAGVAVMAVLFVAVAAGVQPSKPRFLQQDEGIMLVANDMLVANPSVEARHKIHIVDNAHFR